jgi:DNA-binding PadR family transcriptional regulator
MPKKEKTLLLLGSLERGPLYGYELYRTLRAHDRLYDEMKPMSIPSVLDQLVADGCLHREILSGVRAGRHKRIIYALTHKGYEQFVTLLRDVLLTERSSYKGVEMALFFLDRLPETESLELLRARRQVIVNQRALLMANLTCPAIAASSRHFVASYALCLLDAELAWIDQSLAAWQTKPASE